MFEEKPLYSAIKALVMITTVTPTHMIPIPEDISRTFGIQPGWRLDWSLIEGRDEILVRVIPGRGESARRLLGAGQRFSPERDSVAELLAEREAEG
jgi:hypothetical protein